MILQLITIISDNDYITDDRDNNNNNNNNDDDENNKNAPAQALMSLRILTFLIDV